MHLFSPDQRWTSEGEPELGIGIVTELSKGRVKVHFPRADATRLYSLENAPLRRVRFKEGDTIEDQEGRKMVIEEVHENAGVLIYLGKDHVIPESALGNITVQHGADDRLLMGEVDTPAQFALRRKTLTFDHQRRISPVNGFVGGRIDLIHHQLYIAHEVSSRYAPRVLLSDEVGLGKTIEACLILHRLLLSGRISRVLILVPDSLVHQWFVELLRRFNLWFHLFDEERCEASEAGAPEGNPFLDDQLIICATSFLAGSPKRALQALQAGWDLLVVDEAHHLEWSPEEVSPEYGVVEALSQVAEGLLLLTATPEQLGIESHFARLRLLDPHRYTDLTAFQQSSRDQQDMADIVEKLASGEKLIAKEKKTLAARIGEKRVNEQLDETGRTHLIEELLDQYGPGRVVFRNTRSAMQGFPVRNAHLVSLESEGRGDPHLNWLLELMEQLDPAKVLLICRTREKVLALENAIKSRVRLKVGIFHEDLTLVQRDRNAAWFAEPNGARLLLCSEIGSEGRNFQFAHHLVLFDLPPLPELLEQRIGRLDRIGQTEDIQIHVPYLSGSPEEVWVRWYHEGLNAFEKNLQGGNQIARLFRERVAEAAESGDPAKVNELITETKDYYTDLRDRLAKGRDRLLEMNSFRPRVADQLVKQIREADGDPSLETYMMEVFEEFTIETEDLAPRTFLLHPPGRNSIAFPGIPDEGIGVTFDRKRALSREEISFLSWDHPMVTGAIDQVLSGDLGNASFGILQEGSPGVLLEVLFVLETVGGQNLNVDRFLPRTPLRVVVNHAGREVTEAYPVDLLEAQLRTGFIEDIIQNEVLVETLLPNMVAAATDIVDQMAQVEIARGLTRMGSTLKHEIDRLKTLKNKNSHIRPEEIQFAEREQEALATLIKSASVRLDAVQLIQQGDF